MCYLWKAKKIKPPVYKFIFFLQIQIEHFGDTERKVLLINPIWVIVTLGSRSGKMIQCKLTVSELFRDLLGHRIRRTAACWGLPQHPKSEALQIFLYPLSYSNYHLTKQAALHWTALVIRMPVHVNPQSTSVTCLTLHWVSFPTFGAA